MLHKQITQNKGKLFRIQERKPGTRLHFFSIYPLQESPEIRKVLWLNTLWILTRVCRGLRDSFRPRTHTNVRWCYPMRPYITVLSSRNLRIWRSEKVKQKLTCPKNKSHLFIRTSFNFLLGFLSNRLLSSYFSIVSAKNLLPLVR